MKYTIYLVLIFFVFSCSSKQEKPSVLENEASSSSSEFELTKDQIDLAKIKLGKAEINVIQNYIECVGMVDVPPQNRATISAPLGGVVSVVNFYPGDYVKKGEALCRLQNELYIQLQSDYLNALNQVDFLQNEFNRKQKLFEAKAISEKDFLNQKVVFNQEKIKINALEEKLKWAGFNLNQIQENGIQPYLQISSPISGYITEVKVNLGKQVNQGETLYELIDNSHLHLELNVYQKDINAVKPKQVIEFKLPESDQIFFGEVYLVGQKIDPENRTINVHGHFEEKTEMLKTGSILQAKIITSSDSVLAIPKTATFEENGKVYAFIENADHFEKIEISEGKSDEDFIEIIGNKEKYKNLNFVLEGVYYLKSGELESSHNH